MPDDPALHPSVVPLAALLGTWRGEGHGEYPTIEPFDYHETVVFAHVGKPFLSYQQRTADSATGLPLHSESGYLRAVGGERLEMTIAQPSGILEVLEGTWSDDGGALVVRLESTAVPRTATAKRVDAVRRTLRVEPDLLSYTLHMAAVGEPLTLHLTAALGRLEG